MEILILLIPLSVALALLVGGAFWWSVKSGQFDDLEGPAHRILADDDAPGPESNPVQRDDGDSRPRKVGPAPGGGIGLHGLTSVKPSQVPRL